MYLNKFIYKSYINISSHYLKITIMEKIILNVLKILKTL